MARLTTAQVTRLDKSNPENQRVQAWASVKETQDYAPILIEAEIAADSTGNPTVFTAPYAMRVTDIDVLAYATSGGGTLSPYKNGNLLMCTAIACAVDGVKTRMSAGAVVANRAYLTLAAGDTITVDAANAADRGVISFWARRI